MLHLRLEGAYGSSKTGVHYAARRRRSRVAAGGAGATGRANAAYRSAWGGTERDVSDPRLQPNTAAFLQGLQQLGWTDGRNIKIDYRWPAADADKARTYAAELVALAPEVILAVGTPSLVPLLQATRAVPIVFVAVSDPVGAGYVDSLARPGGNATGFMVFEYDLSAKWLELLKEIAPGVTRAAVLRDPATSTGIAQFAVIQSVSRLVGVEVSPLNLPDSGEIEPTLATFARREIAA